MDTPWSWPFPIGCRLTRRVPATWSRPVTRPCKPRSSARTSRVRRIHDALVAADSLDGMPVVIADLHSALPAIVAGIRADDPAARIAYVLTDGGALPAWYSRTLAGLAVRTVRDGQHRPGLRRRRRNRHRALRPAGRAARAGCRHRGRDPGAGQSRHRDAVGVLGRRRGGSRQRGRRARRPGGRGAAHLRRRPPRAAPRAYPITRSPPSAASPWRRSNWSCRPAWNRAWPRRSPMTWPSMSRAGNGSSPSRPPGWTRRCGPVPVRLSTMGRDLDQDYAYFLTSAAAGRHAAALLRSSTPAEGES